MGTRTSEDRVPVLASIHRMRLVKAAPGGLPLSTRWPGTVLRGGTTSTASLLQLQRDQARAEPAADLRQQLGVLGDAAAQLHRLDPAAGRVAQPARPRTVVGPRSCPSPRYRAAARRAARCA